MGFFGLGTVVRHIAHGSPWLHVMRVIGISALLANLICVILRMASRDGDANMRSVRVCLRNDVIANLEILLAALGVFGAGTG